MIPENAFLDAIVHEPDEMAHRLVYADWLDDLGDEASRDRAEFIRAQIERQSLHPAHPRGRALARREAELLSRYETAWAGRVAQLTGRWRFHRGFVEEVSLGVEQFPDPGEELFRITPVRRLRLRGLNSLAALPWVGCLALADCLRRVKVLDLKRESLGEAAVAGLLSLPQLPQLESLVLGRGPFEGVGRLADSPMLASLKTLEFWGPARGDLQILLHSPRLERLESLSLSGARLGDPLVAMLAGSPRMGKLRALSLGHGSLTPEGVRELIDSPAAGRLESLDLSFNSLGVEGVRVLACGDGLGRLTQLNLSRTNLEGEGVAVLADSPLLGWLLGLDLSLNRIGSTGAFRLARRTQPVRLMALDLIYNSLDPPARRRLAERFGEEVCLFDR